MLTENDKSSRKTYQVRKIENDKKALTKDAVLLAASALAVGVGILGVYLFGKNALEAFQSDDALTLRSYLSVRFQGSALIISAGAFIGGVYAAIKNFSNLISSFKTFRDDKSFYETMEEEKGRKK